MPSILSLIALLARRALLPVLACALLAAPAAAHTKIQSTQPANGDTVASVLAEVRVRFSTAVAPGLTRIELRQGGRTVLTGGAPVDGEGNREYVLQLAQPLAPGAYEAQWTTAGADGHVLRGTFRFVVAAPATPVTSGPLPTEAAKDSARVDSSLAAGVPGDPDAVGTTTSAAASPLSVAVRWGWFAALLAMIGVVAFRFGVLARLAKDEAFRPVAARAEAGAWTIALGAASLSMLTLAGRLWLQAAALGMRTEDWSGEQLTALVTGTVWGLGWLLQAIATCAFVMGMLIARAPHGRTAGWMGAAGSVVLLAAVPGLSGHAAGVEGLTAVAIVSDALHVLAAGAWIGSLLMVLAIGIPATLGTTAAAYGAVAMMVRAFSPMALISGAVVGATGVVSALLHIGAVDNLWGTGYGRALLLKVALLTLVGATGFYNWRRVLPGLGADDAGTRRLQRSARVELAIAAAVLLVTAVLVALPTP
ncbi:copper resistance CopC/CopD family protein [Longimicrobium sp.]|jgi:copper transport protein|uniref:copper resistance CopC/CopD family protein n=1 Tax=Longimicrobium sp. TaxID=2029185 RepID=UPI002EDBA0EA